MTFIRGVQGIFACLCIPLFVAGFFLRTAWIALAGGWELADSIPESPAPESPR